MIINKANSRLAGPPARMPLQMAKVSLSLQRLLPKLLCFLSKKIFLDISLL